MNNNFTLVDLFFLNKKNFKVIGTLTSIGFILSIFYSSFAQPLYKSYISLYPTQIEQTRLNMPSFNAAGAALGFNFGNDNNGFNIPDIINSRRLRKVIANKDWESNLFKKPINLINYWQLDKPSFLNIFSNSEDISKEHLQNIAIEKLGDRIAVYEYESGLIDISILMEDELLASNIVNFISEWIQNYISNEMSFKATKNRLFIEEQLKSSNTELFVSEESLSEFLKENSVVDDNPEVMLKKKRLIRNVEVNQEVYITLRKQFELNKIDELKEKHTLKILDVGDIPTEKSKPLRSLIVICGTMLVFFLSNLYIYCYQHYLKEIKTKPS